MSTKSKVVRVEFYRATNGRHKMVAKFFDQDHHLVKQTNFGQYGAKDYIRHTPQEKEQRKQNYLRRHSNGRENWNNPFSAGALSRWILWNKPTLEASIIDFKHRFNLQ